MKRLSTVLTVTIALALVAGPLGAGENKMNTSLKFLRHVRENRPVADIDRPMLQRAVSKERTAVTVEFDHVLSASEIDAFEAAGISFHYIDGEVARTRSIYPVRVPWSEIDSFTDREEVLRIESNWNPAVFPLLDVSNHEIEADSAWAYMDPYGYPITGRGIRIADFDTGIDVFHPSFFYADGDTFDWINYDGSGPFDPDYDGVDLNENGSLDYGERLRFMEGYIYDPAEVWGSGYPSNSDNVYQTYWDWLFNDANENGYRDFGPLNGFTESDPTYGELLFIALDEDDDGMLEDGERIVALNTSKIYATMNADSTERVRGVDLIYSDSDTRGHGTPVAGILAGGTPGRHRFTGIAPDAELLMGYYFSDVAISYLIPWARSRGADVMLYEFGGFIWRYLDGSSLEEQLISIENETILQVTPSGNLGRGEKHAIATVMPWDSVTLPIGVPTFYGGDILEFYGSTLWRTLEGDLTFRLKSPHGGQIILKGSDAEVDGYDVWSDRSTSSRGTCRLDMYIERGIWSHCLGDWELTVVNDSEGPIEIISNVADHLSSWADGAEFTDHFTDERNVTWPATSDSSFVNGSYSTRGFEGYGGVGGGSITVGEISKFSGRGKRIDGRTLLDICSPGNYDVYTTRSHRDAASYPLGSYRQFSGTSAAGPHVAAAAALVRQAFPADDMAMTAYRLTSSAIIDPQTYICPNDTWGYGKLRILGAIGIVTAVEDIAGGLAPERLLLDRNYPNPFNPTTWIPFYLPEAGKVSLNIYDVRGRLVKILRNRRMAGGPHSVRWDGTGRGNRPLASGLYFCVLRFGEETQSRKLVLMR